jgi:hypothetical protein
LSANKQGLCSPLCGEQYCDQCDRVSLGAGHFFDYYQCVKCIYTQQKKVGSLDDV